MLPMPNWLSRVAKTEPGETGAVLWSFAYFFCLLCGYYVLRPLRDEMGIAGGVNQLPWVFTGTFLAMLAAVPLYGWVASHWPRRKFLPMVYLFFIANLLAFYLLFEFSASHEWVARAFFIWVSVFNLFVVSVFWSFMVDLFSSRQGKRLFGLIAAGGSLGAVTGPAVTAWSVGGLGVVNLLLISAFVLTLATLCLYRLIALSAAAPVRGANPNEALLGGHLLGGVKLLFTSPYLLSIAAFVLLLTTLSTFVYFEQARIVKATHADPALRTALFAKMDLAVNALSILTQMFLAGRLLSRWGISRVLFGVGLVSFAGFVGLALFPVLGVFVAFQVVRRALEYALARPAREVLFTVVEREAKYKAKNVIDTLVYRGGDALSAWLVALLKGLGAGASTLAAIGAVLALAWALLGKHLGRRQTALGRETV
jgi:AAA family ATP:ADP antiporter